MNKSSLKMILLVWIVGALCAPPTKAANVESPTAPEQSAMSAWPGCFKYLQKLAGDSLRRRAERTPVANFMFIEKEDATPIVIPRPNVLVSSGNGETPLRKIDYNDAFVPFAKNKIKLQIPFAGRTAAIGAHGLEDGSLDGLSTNELITLLVWLKKKKGVETVAILSCYQNVRRGTCSIPMINPYFSRLGSQLTSYGSTLPRVVIAHPPMVGQLALVEPASGGAEIIGWKHPEGEFIDAEDGERYIEVVFTQQLYPFVPMREYQLRPPR